MKKLTLLFSMLISLLGWGQSNDGWSPEKIGTVTAGTVATGGLGYKSFTNFSAAKSIVQKNTEVLIDSGHNAKFFEPSEVETKVAKVSNGDDVIIQYHLSESANRQWWVDDYRSSAASARSSASYHEMQALTATKARYISVSDGKGGMKSQYAGQEPDWVQRAYHASQASSDRARAITLDAEANAIANGKAVPWKKFTKEFTKEATTKSAVKNALNEIMTSNGGKVYSVSRLPKIFANEARSKGLVGWVFTGLAVVAGAGTVYEAITGDLAGTIESDLAKGSFEFEFNDSKSSGSQAIGN